MEQKEKRFALIFKPVNEKYELDVGVLLDYDETTDEYQVCAGKYKGSTKEDFAQLVGKASFINAKGTDLYLVESLKKEKPYIFVFEPKDIDILAEENEYTKEQVYHYIINKANRLKLLNVGGNEWKAMFVMKNRIVPYTSKDIAEMLYDHVTEEKIEELSLPIKEVDPLGEFIDHKENDDSPTYNSFEQAILKGLTDVMDDPDIKIEVGVLGPDELPPFLIPQPLPEEKTKQREKMIDDIIKETKERTEKRKAKTDIDVSKMIEEISSKIIGQEDAIKTLVANICFNQKLIDFLELIGNKNSGELDARKVSILLDGSTGTGKTAIAKEIAEKLSLPIKIVNANSFSETGYVGPTITDILNDLLEQADGDIDLAERGIVVFDEIDKLATNTAYEGRDMKQGVQEELLGFLSGGSYDVSSGKGLFGAGKGMDFDTSKLTFILSGAFTSIKEKKIKENETTSIGFGQEDTTKEKEYEVTPQDYIDYGLMREFFGRVKVLTSTKTYSEEDLKNILLESSISPIKNFEKTVQMYGYKGISYEEEFLDEICKEAYDMETGARGLQTIMSGIQNKMLLDLMEGTYDKEHPIPLSTENIKEYKKGNRRSY